MDKNEAMQHLTNLLKDYDWFTGVDLCPQTKRVTVYTKYMDKSVYAAVPNMLGTLQIMLAFEGYRSGGNYKNDLTKTNHVTKPLIEDVSAYAELVNEGPELIPELDRLEKICGSNMLQDIFYEVHDGKNAVTNLSSRYPEVREALDVLYANYGFDVIYEELDG
jgi:hypothetical protein